MKIYIATAFVDATLASEVASMVERAGHTITHRWWHADKRRYADDESYRCECADKRWTGVRNSDVVVLLNHPFACTARVEMGIAFGWGKSVVVVSPERKDCVFDWWDAYITRLADINQLIKALTELES
jgi:hypothetical protein